MVMTALETWLEQVKKRKEHGHPSLRGVTLASDYFGALAPCLGDNACQAHALGLGDAKAWMDSLKAAETTLIHTDEGAGVVGGRLALDGQSLRLFGNDDSSQKKAKELTAGSIMDFDAIITTTRKDRDRDVLESEGAVLDDKMPLLWQHIPLAPIGKYVDLVKRTRKQVVGAFAVAGTALGHDAAILAEFGALRISHGFRPLEYEPLEKDPDEPDWYQGFHVLKFEVMETSLVSVPSNTDAQITAISRGKLHSPLVKAYAQRLWDGLPPMVRSGWESVVKAPPTPDPPDQAPAKETPACGCQGASATRAPVRIVAVGSGKSWAGFALDGSWEWIAEKLEDAASAYLEANNIVVPPDADVDIVGTFADSVIVSVLVEDEDGEEEGEPIFYRIGWNLMAGEPTFNGTPEVVELVVTVATEGADGQASSAVTASRHLAAQPGHRQACKRLITPTVRSTEDVALELVRLLQAGKSLSTGYLLALDEEIVKAQENNLIAAAYSDL